MLLHLIGSAVALLVLALLILGTSWGGQVRVDGTWVDGVSLRQWAVFLVAVAAVGVVVGPRITTARDRLIPLLPTFLWLGIALWGTLGPIPLVIYLVPTALVWFAALAVGGRRSIGLARTMKS
jgi:hypothetical protein